MEEAKQFSVNWSNHMNHIKQAFDNLLNNNDFTDVTLYVEGNKIGAHKMLLSACSDYFSDLFRDIPQEHPIIVLKGVRFCVLRDILKFIYSGEVSVDSEHFNHFLQTAEFLQISGLTSSKNENCGYSNNFTNGESKIEHAEKPKKRKKSSQHDEEKNDSEDYHDQSLSSIFANNICDIEMGTESVQDFVNYENEEIIKKEFMEDDSSVNADGNLINNHTVDNLTCPICYKVFTHPYSLHHHKPVHLGRTKCPICNVVLSRKYNLKMHMKSKHNVV